MQGRPLVSLCSRNVQEAVLRSGSHSRSPLKGAALKSAIARSGWLLEVASGGSACRPSPPGLIRSNSRTSRASLPRVEFHLGISGGFDILSQLHTSHAQWRRSRFCHCRLFSSRKSSRTSQSGRWRDLARSGRHQLHRRAEPVHGGRTGVAALENLVAFTKELRGGQAPAFDVKRAEGKVWSNAYIEAATKK